MDKVYAFTGGTSGVGFAIMEALAAGMTGDIVFTGTSAEAGEKIVGKSTKDHPAVRFHFIPADLSEKEGIKRFVHYIRDHFNRLDVLSLNAGILNLSLEYTSDRLEKTFALNYLSAAELLLSLQDMLLKPPHTRVGLVTGKADTIAAGRLNLDDPGLVKDYNGFKAAVHTALMKTVAAFYLAEAWESNNFTINVFHPGVVRSRLVRSLPPLIRPLAQLTSSLFFSPRSKTGEYLFLSPEMENTTGAYLSGKKTVIFPRREEHMRQAEDLWSETLRIIEARNR